MIASLSINYSFTLTVQSDCLTTIFSDKTISNMIIKIGQDAVTQDITFSDTIASSRSIPSHCGARTYTLIPTHTFLTISGTTLSLATSTITDVGTYTIDLRVSLADYSGVAPITK
jgi:hypothetical protein